MRAKDLRKYKTLDITELSGSPWNNAEKVLGLDENDKVLMAEPDGVVTPEDIADAIAAETARTEETYIKQEVIPEVITGSRVGSDGDYDMLEFVKSDTTTGDVIAMQRRYIKKINGVSIISPYREDNIELPTEESIEYAISQAMESETARTEDIYAKKSEVPVADDYYTKDETDGAISTALVPYATKGWVSSQSYANQNYVMFKVNEAMQIETARTESTYAKPSDIPSLDGYATEQYVDDAIATAFTIDDQLSSSSTNPVENRVIANALDNKPEKANVAANTNARYFPQWNSDGIIIGKFGNIVYNVGHSINGVTYYIYRDKNSGALPAIYAPTSAGTQGQILVSTGGEPVWSDNNFVTSGDVANQIDASMAAETARTESTYLKEHQSLDNYYNKGEVDAKFVSAATEVGNAIDAAVQGLASETYVNNAVDGLASEDYVNDVVSAATEGMATQEYVDNAVAGIDFPDDYATTGDVANAVEGLASENYVDDAITSATEGMATQSDLEGLASESYVDDAVNGVVQGIGMLGMVNDVSEDDGTVTVQKTTMQEGQLVTGSTSFNIATPGDIQTAIASETARTESTYLKEHQSLDNYYTKSQVDAEITGATEDMATKTWVASQGYLTEHQDLSDYAKTTAVTADIATAMASETARTEETYATLEDVYGVTASTQMEITTADTQYQCWFSTGGSGYYQTYFKETNIPGYLAFRLNDRFSEYTGEYLEIQKVRMPDYRQLRYSENYTASTETLGTYKGLTQISNNYNGYIPYSLDNSYDYYLVFNVGEEKLAVFKTLPVVDVITRTVPAYEDIPVAQDGSNKKVFVYDFGTGGDGSRRVVSSVRIDALKEPSRPNRQGIQFLYKHWNNNEELSSGAYVNIGTNKTAGFKADYDSDIIFDAGSALAGFSEQITLTPTGQSANDSIYGRLTGYSNSYIYFQETNNPRYEVLPCSAITNANNYIQYFYIGGTSSSNRYYAQEYDGGGSQNPLLVPGVKGKLGKNSVGTSPYVASIASTNNYIILDKETLQYEIATSLTITRAKNLQSTIGNIETLLANI